MATVTPDAVDPALQRLQGRLGPRAAAVALPGRALISEGVLFEDIPGSKPTANVRECFLCSDVLLIVASAGRAELALTQVPLSVGFSAEDLDWRRGGAPLGAPPPPPEDSFVVRPAPAVPTPGAVAAAPRPVTLVAPDHEYKALWFRHLQTALSNTLPEAARTEAGWVHRILTGTLWHAALTGDVAVVEGLVALRDAGADHVDVNAEDADGVPPLHYAVSSGNVAVARALLHASARLEAVNALYESPLHVAARLGDASMVELLCANGARTDARDLVEQTALHIALGAAAAEGAQGASAVDAVAALLSYGADPAAADGSGLHPLHLAALNNLPPLVEQLVGHGADVGAMAEFTSPGGTAVDRFSPLFLACAPPLEAHLLIRGPTDWPRPVSGVLIGELLAHGAQPNSRSGVRKLTPLHLILSALQQARRGGPSATGLAESAESAALVLASLQSAATRLADAGARLDIADAGGVTCAQLADACGLRGPLDAASRAFAARGAHPATATVAHRLEYALLSAPIPALSSALERAFRTKAPSAGGLPPKRLGVAADMSAWTSKADAPECSVCGNGFTLLKRRHHCRQCCFLVCGACSTKTFPLANPGSARSGAGRADSDDDSAAVRPTAALSEQRVCDGCFNQLFSLTDKLLREPPRPVPTAKARAGGGASSESTAPVAKAESAEAARRTLLGSAPAASSKAPAAPGARQSAQAAGIQATLGDAKASLGQRGEKLSRLDERTAQMASRASDFADLAAQLKAKQSSWW